MYSPTSEDGVPAPRSSRNYSPAIQRNDITPPPRSPDVEEERRGPNPAGSPDPVGPPSPTGSPYPTGPLDPLNPPRGRNPDRLPDPPTPPRPRSPILQRWESRNTQQDDRELKLLRRQVALLEQMVKQQNNPSSSRGGLKLAEIYLPDLDPDDHKLTMKDWCKQVDSLINFRGCSMQVAMMKALSCLKGRAKTWADANAYCIPNWPALKEELLSQFGAETRHIYFVNKFKEYTSNDAENYAEYVSEAWRLFSRISPNAPVDLQIEAVISGIRPKYYQAELLRAVPKSQAELIATLSNYRKRLPTEFQSSDFVPEKKRPRLDTTVKPHPPCNKCGRRGHKTSNCKACSICKKFGHTSNSCFKRTSHYPSGPNSNAGSSQPQVNVVQKTCSCCSSTGNDK